MGEMMEFATQAINEAKLSPPPTLPDIKQVLMADARARLLSAEPTHGRILMDGNVVYTICYLSVQDTCCSFSATAAFKTTVETNGVLPDSILSVWVGVSDCESVQGGPREIYLKSAIDINASAVNNQRQVALDARDQNLITKSSLKNVSFIRDVKTRMVPIREDVKLPMSIEDIVNLHGYAKGCDIMFDENSAVVTGEMVVNVLMRTGNESAPLCTHTAAIPFEQLFTLENYQEGDYARVEANIDELNAVAIEGESNLICIEAMLSIKLTLCGKETVEITCDAYCQDTVIEISKQNHTHTYDSFGVSLSKETQLSSDISGVDSGETVVMLRPLILWKQCSKDSVSLEGMADIYAFFMQGDSLMCRKLEAPFAYELPIGGMEEDNKCAIRCGVRDAKGEIADGKVNVSCTLDFQIQVYACEEMEVAVGATDTGEKVEKNAGIFIYFANGKDSTFDVAKKYRTTEKQIMELNPDISDNLYEGQKVLIIAS